jgi:hypothetical protein
MHKELQRIRKKQLRDCRKAERKKNRYPCQDLKQAISQVLKYTNLPGGWMDDI